MNVPIITALSKDNARQIKNRQQQGSGDLEELIIALIISKENYKALARTTRSLDLKAICNQHAAERTELAFKLYRHIGLSGGIAANQADLLWVDKLWTASHKGDAAILNIIIKSETTAIKKYETYLSNH